MSEHGYKEERNKTKYEYEWKGKKHFYIPDFLVDNKLVEIKGFPSSLTEAKLKAVTDKEISILYYKDLEHMMNYIDNKYHTVHTPKTNNYETLYDGLVV